MFQSLLEDRFKLVVRKETKPLPTYALTAGKKPQLKEGDGTEETVCRPKTTTGSPVQIAKNITGGLAHGSQKRPPRINAANSLIP
jgi:uncharacterized protein (TIGR03435 family)